MRYTVISHPSADADLARIWATMPDRKAIQQASDRIDDLLKQSPLSCGTPLGDDFHLRIDPLEVVYTVIPDDCKVVIQQVAYRRYLSP